MKHNRKIIYLAGFVFSMSVALMSYINSSFLSSFVGEKLVGVSYALGSVISIIGLLLAPRIFRKVGGYRFLIWATGLNALSILLFAFSKNAWTAIILFVLGFVLYTIIVFSLDEILKIFSKESSTGKIRGMYMALSSLAWIIAQLSLGTILGGFSFRTIYLASFVITMLFFLIIYLLLNNIPDPKYDQFKGIKYVREFFKNKNLLRSYSINLLLQFFYCWMVIYTPIYLYAHLGFSWKEIGIIFAIMLLPFFILPFHLGTYSDKIGERKMLMFGFLVASLATLSLFFIERHEIWIWALALLLTRIGAATIEVMSDVYFFKHIRSENEEFIGVYRSATPLAYIIGPLIALIVLFVVPTFNFIYPVLGALMLSGVYLSSNIRRNDI